MVKKQPDTNIGMVGHVDHGKTTLTKALSGQWTDRHSEEIKRGISIKLGYADTTFYKCPECKGHTGYSVKKKCDKCKGKTKELRSVSFVDAPGHETLMATMLSGAAIMDGALLLIAANEKCPQPQTKEHLMALEISGVKNIVIVQNKIDIVEEEQLLENYQQIKEFVAGTIAEDAPIIPVSAHHDANIDVLINAIQEIIPTKKHDAKKPLMMHIARSFDVNKPGIRSDEIMGGIVGGTIIQGVLKVGEEIEIAPGTKIDKTIKEFPIITTKANSLFSGSMKLKTAKPGGLIGIGTMLDPLQTKSDSLIGRIIGKPGSLPPVWDKLNLETHLLERAVGTASDVKVEDLKTNEPLMLNIGTATTVGIITSAAKDIKMNLKIPVCAELGDRVAISRRIQGKWRLIGYGNVKE